MDNLPVAKQGSKPEGSLQYVTFKVGEELFGVDIIAVKEVISPRKITSIPRTPDYLLGIINLRGEVISIIDLRVRFGVKNTQITRQSRIVVIVANGIRMGLLVDKINSIMALLESEVASATSIASSEKQKFISGSYQLPDASILLLLLQDQLVDEKDFKIDQAAKQEQETINLALQVQKEWVKEIHLVGFSINNERYTMESRLVEEIIFLPEMTIVPEMEEFVEGIFYYRNTVIPAIRLCDQLNLAGLEITEDTPVIIANIFNMKIGLIVDEITDVLTIKEDDILPPPIHINKTQAEQLKGVIKLQHDKRNYIVMMLKLEKLFSFEEQGLLKELDSKHERVEEKKIEIKEEMAIFEFMLKGDRYAIELSQTNEIISMRECVPVPKAPPYIKGVINLRGDVISVVDLPRLVDHHNYKQSQSTKLLIVKTGLETVGLIIEKVLGIQKVEKENFKKPSDILQQKGNIFIKSIGKDKKSDEIIILIDLETTIDQAQTVDEVEDLDLIQKELEFLEMEDEKNEAMLLESP